MDNVMTQLYNNEVTVKIFQDSFLDEVKGWTLPFIAFLFK